MKGGLAYTTGFFRQEFSLLSHICIVVIFSNACVVINLLEEKKKEEGMGCFFGWDTWQKCQRRWGWHVPP
jgi:hypothetical protein